MPTGSHLKAVDGTGNPVRVVTNSGVDSSAEQQVMTLADGAGNLLGGTADTPLTSKEKRAATGANTSVAASVTSGTVLASNTNRLGATVQNDAGAAVLYLLLGTGTASATNHTVVLVAGAYYEVPFNYTGQLTGVWAAATGSCRVTELT